MLTVCSFSTVESPTMLPDKFKQFILDTSAKVPVSLSLVTMCSLPSEEESVAKFVKDFLSYKLSRCGEKLLEPEKDSGFAFQEFSVVNTSCGSWNWHPFTKHHEYMSCFVHALEQDEGEKRFGVSKYKQCVFESDALDDCFYDFYRLLSSLYQDKSVSAESMIQEAQSGARLSFVNMWNISFNRSILHFLNLLRGYLRLNFPVLVINLPESGQLLLEKEKVKTPHEPFLQQYTQMQHILQFSHLARSLECEDSCTHDSEAERCRKDFCKIVALVKPGFEASTAAIDELNEEFTKGAERFGVSDVLDCRPMIVGPDNTTGNGFEELKQAIESHCTSRQQIELPLSWMFLRSAFYKTGQLYIKTKKLRKYAQKCKIVDDGEIKNFTRFLRQFTALGSIIHIPDIPVFCDYVILNPADFFYKLNELFCPRFNGDLEFGIVCLSTLRRMFGADVKFFRKVLTSCTFAAEIDSSQIEYVDSSETERDSTGKKRGFSISERCLFVPAIRRGDCSEAFKEPLPSSLYIIHDRKLQPTNITVNAIKFLISEFEKSELTMLTSSAHVVTRFRFNLDTASSPSQEPPRDTAGVRLAMISRCDRHEIRIEGDKDGDTWIKRTIIRAYLSGIKKYRYRFESLLGKQPITHFALMCSSEKTHPVMGEPTECSTCRDSWNLWNHIITNERDHA